MEIRELEQSTVTLIPKLVFMKSDTVLVQYIISKWSLDYRNSSKRWVHFFKLNSCFYFKGNPNEGIYLNIVMNRRIINEVLTTYLPSVFDNVCADDVVTKVATQRRYEVVPAERAPLAPPSVIASRIWLDLVAG